MRRPNIRLRVEELGSRILPSSAPLSTSLFYSATHYENLTTPPAVSAANLVGNLRLTLTPTVKGPIDAGLVYSVTGYGDLGGLPRFTATGSLRRTGFIFRGHATGELTLTNSQGSIMLSLQGPTQAAFAPLPNRFHFTVTGGTGAYKGVSDDGVVTLHTYTVRGMTIVGLVFA
jgi:hypothetical protein